ncbi:GNAT family N-acetyltransferase [Cellulomonas sp. WB94]|uniref:GNAT family N-acetyltransferase n=1 Tax=Cellulomonas sp. WB94 TaxID=2173174 RepID=UPI000D56E285|nr:GNAT family N-acetyltransferase [Cellulomonas sp. WB94]PVU83461.1 GNAT family N-acetyltransferase [Cellulomonas sp. WB94]
MRITSLGFRTDIMLLTLQGSDVEDRGDHLVVRTPGNPTFWWGNFVLLRERPGRGGVRRWEETFARELPEAAHRTFGVDGTQGDVADFGEFAAAGYAVDGSAVMTASSVHEPPHPNHDATYRALDLTDRGDRDAAIALQLANAPHREPSSHREFLVRKMEAMRPLQEAGCGSWFGAFVDGRMLSGMGLFSDGSGVARFQSVDTHPDARGRGLAGTLVHHVSRYGLTDLGAATLVMVADPGYHAIDIYRSIGFETTETQLQLERSPG